MKETNAINMGNTANVTLKETGASVSGGYPIVYPEPIDIVVLVAGTSDPINTSDDLGKVNGLDYFKNSETDNKGNNFYSELEALKEEDYPLLIIEGSHEWSGDNNDGKREKASKDLLTLLKTKYLIKYKLKKVHFHLIGHSHGGNVINSFTDYFAKDLEIPDIWKIRSINYLSVPFFNNKNQVNELKFHSDCKVHNVYNYYDFTQRVIADNSVYPLYEIFKKLEKDDRYKSAIQLLERKPAENIKLLLEKIWDNNYDSTDLSDLWVATRTQFIIIRLFLDYARDLIENYDSSSFLQIKENLENLISWIDSSISNLGERIFQLEQGTNNSLNLISVLPDHIEWLVYWYLDIDLSLELDWINTIFAIDENKPEDSFIFSLLSDITYGKGGILEDVDDTYNLPNIQFKSHFVENDPIHEDDPYHPDGNFFKANSYFNYLEDLVSQKKSNKIFLSLLSQFMQYDQSWYFENFKNLVLKIDGTLKSIKLAITILFPVGGSVIIGLLNVDNFLHEFAKNIKAYYDTLDSGNKNLMLLDGPTNTELVLKNISDYRGTLAYFALKSHNLSRTFMTDKNKDFFRDVFESPKKDEFRQSASANANQTV